MRAFDSETPSEIKASLQTIINNLTGSLNKHKKNVYIAGPWFDESSKSLMDAIEEIYKKVKSPLYNLYFPRSYTNENPEKVYKKNVTQINMCDVLVALISRKDVGTAFEIGMAKALGKKIILVAYDEDCYLSKTNIMLAFCTTECITIKKFSKFLQGSLESSDYVKINKTWEGKE